MNHETHKTGTSRRLTRLGIPTALAMLVLPTVAVADAVQWTEAEGGNGHWYEVVEPGPGIAWTQAAMLSEDMGGHLATLTSEDESNFIKLTLDPFRTRIGGYQDPSAPDYSEPSGGWRWVTGEAWNFTNWDTNEPNDTNGGLENFLEMDGGGGIPGGWNDLQDLYNGHDDFLVEWSADCNGDGIVDYGQILDGSLADDNDNGVPDSCENGQWRVEDGGNGHWYSYRLGDMNNAAWTAMAEAEGAHLVTITSEAEGVFVEAVHDAAAPQSSYHTGGYQDINACDYAEPDGGWRWVTGESWQYTNWGYSDGANQPDNLPGWGEGANVMGIRWQENGIWLDTPETIEWAAMFEWSSDCNGDGIVDYGQILDGTYPDMNGNGIPDCCDEDEPCNDFVRGACCLDTMCVLTTASDCFNASGSYAGDGVSCTEGVCGEPCPSDIDGNGTVEVIDILTLLSNWGGCP